MQSITQAVYWHSRPKRPFRAFALHVHRGHLLILLRSVVLLRSVPSRPAPLARSTPSRAPSSTKKANLSVGLRDSLGAGGGGRTLTALRPRDFESRASASSTTPAQMARIVHFFYTCGDGKIQASLRNHSRGYPVTERSAPRRSPADMRPWRFQVK